MSLDAVPAVWVPLVSALGSVMSAPPAVQAPTKSRMLRDAIEALERDVIRDWRAGR